MITVEDIISLPAFRKIQLAVPCDGYRKRKVKVVCVLDSHPHDGHYGDLVPGDFVLSSFGYARGNQKEAEEGILLALDQGIAALAVDAGFLSTVSEEIVKKVANTGIPVFFYEGAYYEQIIVAAENLFAHDKEQDAEARKIDAMLDPFKDQRIDRQLFDLTGIYGSAVRCIAISPIASDKCSSHAFFGQLKKVLDCSMNNTANALEGSFHLCRYREVFLGFLVFANQESARRFEIDKFVQQVREIGPLAIGVGAQHFTGDANLAIKESLMALDEALDAQTAVCCWDAMGVRAFRRAAAADKLFSLTGQANRTRLEEYDAEHGTELAETARVFADSCGSMTIAARMLSQHENTVRYRLKKMRKLFSMEDASDREFYQFLMLVFLGSH